MALMEVKHIYWIAAFLDGEGSFIYTTTPRIQATSTDRDLIDKFMNYSKLNLNICVKIPKESGYKIQYKVSICGSLAAQWMMTIYSLLCNRRKKDIKEVLRKWNLSRVSNKNKIICDNGHTLIGRNLVIDINGIKRCRTCKLNNHRRYKLRNKIGVLSSAS